MSQTSPFHCVELIGKEKETQAQGLFECSIDFRLYYKRPGSRTRHCTHNKDEHYTVSAKYTRKAEAKKAAWNKVIKLAYETFSKMNPQPILKK